MKTALFTALALLLAACGPEQTNRDKVLEERRAVFQKYKEVLTAFEGNYRGELQYMNEKGSTPVLLRVRFFGVLQPNSSLLEVEEIPNLVGFITPRDPGNFAISFTQGRYQGDSGILQLYGPGIGNNSFHYLYLKRDGNKLVGEYVSSRYWSQVEFTRF